MAVEGQRDAKNAALIPSVRTLADSKLGVDLFRGSASWNSIGPLSSNLEEGTPIEFQEADPLKRSTPSLESERVLTLGIRVAFLASRCPFHSHPSSLHSRPKQFPQLLKRSSPNPAVISTTADHLLISP
ncbi:hypothetical protein C4D60_Mb09t19040 [Musa balbisiana]|uniref:Uncharacterized protein n=1 Tax=Musa balbisiana TaxID=52838 RepID=A0A4S8II83_MUSBA|nr:hypothetical protein C4D60_Mb09t19040 [Musa balbisiana]